MREQLSPHAFSFGVEDDSMIDPNNPQRLVPVVRTLLALHLASAGLLGVVAAKAAVDVGGHPIGLALLAPTNFERLVRAIRSGSSEGEAPRSLARPTPTKAANGGRRDGGSAIRCNKACDRRGVTRSPRRHGRARSAETIGQGLWPSQDWQRAQT